MPGSIFARLVPLQSQTCASYFCDILRLLALVSSRPSQKAVQHERVNSNANNRNATHGLRLHASRAAKLSTAQTGSHAKSASLASLATTLSQPPSSDHS